ncbi:MAG: hydroxyacid dehydrogenase [Terrimicrobiaceae bacterium]
MNQPKAVLVGFPDSLKQAYPESLREELAGILELSAAEFSAEEWRANPSLVADAQILMGTWGFPKLDADFLAAAPNLKAVFYAAGSVKGFATEEAFERGISISCAYEANAIPVSEFTLGAILLSFKRVWASAREVREKRTYARDLELPGGYRSKVGLVALGAIGRRVAGLLRSFDVEVWATDPWCSPQDAAKLNAKLVSLQELFRGCDIVSLHAPWLPETEKMISRDLLASMKPGATFINTARGAVVDEDALCSILRERPDLTAILDVTYPEPPPSESPLYDLPNLILTPHIAGSVGTEVARMGRWMVDECRRFLRGDQLIHAVDAAALGRMA